MNATLERPALLPVRTDGIPAAMRLQRRWVGFRLQLRGDKWTKVPCVATPPWTEASSTDPGTWSTFEAALEAYTTSKCDGIGFVLGNGWSGFDADGTDAPEFVQLLNSYTERSVGGRGIHVICRGTKPGRHARKGPYELYDSGRYFTVTGHHIPGTPTTVEERTAELAALYARLFANGNGNAGPPTTTATSNTLDDDAVISRARDAKTGAKFKALWVGDTSGYPSASEADAALCAILAYWTNRDPGQIDRLFRRSGLMRDKWSERRGESTYGASVIEYAISHTPKGYADERSGIVQTGGELTSIVDRAEAALLTAGVPIYQRGGILTRAVKLDTAIGETHVVRRDVGSTVLISVRELWLVEQMARAACWLKRNAKGECSSADPEPKYAHTLLARGEWRFPVLRGVVTAPTLARDGRIIAAPGFDKTSGLLLDFPAGAFPSVPERPSKDEALAALGRLTHPLRGFPFVGAGKNEDPNCSASRSVAVSAMLTALIRLSLRTAPLHGFDAPAAGTGKSLLAELIGLLATGFRPPALSQGKTDEEDEKRLSTVLFAGDPVILIDNCERAISGDFLCSMLTQEVVQARILGLSERRVLPSTALVLATGNNLTLAGDTSRRAVICRLDAHEERPDARHFDFDCHAEVLASRPELVVAGLTILRAYHIAGKPQAPDFRPMGGFTDYDWVRGALVWLGLADPEETRSAILDNDPRKNELLNVMELWERAFGDQEVEVSDIARLASEPNEEARALHDCLVEVACRGKWSSKSVGWWLRRQKDRVVGKRSFRCEPGAGRLKWELSGARPPENQPEQQEAPF